MPPRTAANAGTGTATASGKKTGGGTGSSSGSGSGSASGLSKKLKTLVKGASGRFKEELTRARDSGPGFTEKDDGVYVGRLMSVALGENQSGELQLVWTYRHLEGEYKGDNSYDTDRLEREDAFYWLGRKLLRYGVEFEDPSQLEEIIEALNEAKPVVKFRLRTKNDYQNLILIKVLEDYEEDEEEDEDTSGESEEEESEEESESEEEEEESEEEEEEEEEVELEEGMTVTFTVKGEEMTGTVKEVLEDEEKAKIKVGTKLYKIPIENLTIAE